MIDITIALIYIDHYHYHLPLMAWQSALGHRMRVYGDNEVNRQYWWLEQQPHVICGLVAQCPN